jgi:uncharacterized protein (UPF0248 family)
MIPLQKLLARIRWDPRFARGRFELAYVDHQRPAPVRIALDRIRVRPGNRFSFDCVDEDGNAVSIPFHRVRIVFRDGVPVWKRPEQRLLR